MMIQTNVAQHPAAQPIARNLIAVASGKGGVGKTWLSITLSHALARLGHKVLLFDGDLGLANVDIQLGLMPRFDVGTVISGRALIQDAITPFEAGGFDILAGRSGSGSLATIPASQLGGLRSALMALCPSYDMVVLDLAAGLEDNVRALAALAGTCLIVTSDEPTSITDAYAFVKVLASQRRAASVRLLVNMAGSIAEGEKTYQTLAKACEGFLNIWPPLAGIVRRDNKVRESIRRQTPIIIRHPSAPAAADVEAIAAKLAKTI